MWVCRVYSKSLTLFFTRNVINHGGKAIIFHLLSCFNRCNENAVPRGIPVYIMWLQHANMSTWAAMMFPRGLSCEFPTAHKLTFALQALPHEAPQQGAAVVTESGDLVVVDTELMGHINTEPLWAHLQRETHTEEHTDTHTGALTRGQGGIIRGAFWHTLL